MDAEVTQARPKRRMLGGLAALVVVLAAIAVIVVVNPGGTSHAAGPSSTNSDAATVQRRDLVSTDTESGTLGYANAQTVYDSLTGTITWLPAVGQVIQAGQTLFKVDGQPVILFNGSVPAYRTLEAGITDGPDVLELNADLVAMGFADNEITVDDEWQQGTTDAIERWQDSLGETETGTITLGQVVFLPGAQRITDVNTTLGSDGASNGGGSSGDGSDSDTSYDTPGPGGHTEFASLTTPTTTSPRPTCKHKNPNGTCPRSGGGGQSQLIDKLIAALNAETRALEHGKSPSGTGTTGTGKSGTGTTGTGKSGTGASGTGASGDGSTGTGSSGTGNAQAVLDTTSNELVVTVDLDATKQSEAVVGRPVTVEMPNGSTINGKVTAVSPVAQNSSSGSGDSGSSGSGSSGSSSSTIPVTVTLTGRHQTQGLDQAAVSVNFEQQIANNVLSVPVTALLATQGGGYAVQEAAAPHKLIPVTTGLFAAGYVQISGSGIYSGLQVTDSQG